MEQASSGTFKQRLLKRQIVKAASSDYNRMHDSDPNRNAQHPCPQDEHYEKGSLIQIGMNNIYEQ